MARFKLPKLPKLSEVKLPNLRDPLTRRKLPIYLFILGAVFILFSVVMMGVTATPQSCNLFCHSMDPEYNTWKRSAHANVTCIACHSAPGGALTKIAEDILVNIPIGAREFIGFEKPINAESEVSQKHFESERCFRCHNINTRRFSSSKGIIMTGKAHQKHLDVGLECATCHNRITHKGAENFEPIKTWVEEEKKEGFRYKNFMDMKEGCLRCHQTKKPRTLRGKRAPTTCNTCHPPDWEKLPVGHAKGWRKAHGPIAQQNFNYCFKCHDETARYNFDGKNFCLACHDEEDLGRYQSQAKEQPI